MVWLIYGLFDWLSDWLMVLLIDGLIDWWSDWLMVWLIDGLIDWSMGWLSDGLIDWWSDWLIGWFTGAGGAGGDSSAEVKELKAALDKAEADRAKVSNRTSRRFNTVVFIVHMYGRMPSATLLHSVRDPWHFGAYPVIRIRTSD